MNPIKIYGRQGNVNAARGVNQDTQSHVGLQPSSLYGEHIIFFSQLEEKTDEELLETAFSTLSNSGYGTAIRRQFALNTGETMKHTVHNWYNDHFSGKTDFFAAIEKEIQAHHSSFHYYRDRIDVSGAIRDNMPSFRFAPFNVSEMIAIGGIQEVEVSNLWLNQEFGHDYWDGKGNLNVTAHTTTIRFKILLKDWFGVDEGDFTNLRLPAWLDRRGLTALWMLQHQRGYNPFINVFEYFITMKIKLGTSCAYQ